MRFNESKYSGNDQLDFVPRSRQTQIWRIILAFVLTMIVIGVLGSISTTGRNISVLFFSMMIVAALCFWVVYRKQESLDLVMNTEYQNLLFAQAAALGTSFCIFVHRDGTIVYANDGLRKLFPKFGYANNQALEGLFEHAGIAKPDRERISAAIGTHTSDRLAFPLQIGDEKKELIVTIEPLARPGGFSVVRGREYQDQRTGTQLLPDTLRSTSADKIDQLLTRTPIAHYTTDAFGKLEYVNPAMEHLLGYRPDEMTDAKLSIQHLLYQLGGRPLPTDYTLADHQGPARMQRRDQSLISLMLFQYVMRDQAGKILGASGSIISTETTPTAG